MSIITINLANRKFKISYNPNDKANLLNFVKILDNKIKTIFAQNKLAPLELVLVIIALKLEKHVSFLNQENRNLKKILQQNEKDLKEVKNRLQNICQIDQEALMNEKNTLPTKQSKIL